MLQELSLETNNIDYWSLDNVLITVRILIPTQLGLLIVRTFRLPVKVCSNIVYGYDNHIIYQFLIFTATRSCYSLYVNENSIWEIGFI